MVAPVLPIRLAFFPNAPYLVTHLLHLQPAPGVPFWFDALLYGGFAMAGCALSWTSLAAVRARFAHELGQVGAELALLGSCSWPASASTWGGSSGGRASTSGSTRSRSWPARWTRSVRGPPS